MSPLLMSTLLALAVGAEDPRLEWTLGATGGYESNLTLATSGQGGGGSAVASASADLGLTLEPTEKTQLYAGGRYEGWAYSDAADLNRNTFGGTLLLAYALTDRVALLAIPYLGYGWYGNSARDGLMFVGKALLRAKPAAWMTVRVGYARFVRTASDDVYSIRANRFLASAEARAASGTYVALGYVLQAGEQVFYRNASGFGGMGPGTGEAGGGTGMFSGLVPYTASATQSTISPMLEQRVGESFYISGRYDYTWGSTDAGRYSAHAVYAGLTYRL